MAWVALGVGQLVAGIGRPQGSPVAAVGSAAIDHTPPPVKNFAISAFGSHDKTVLVIGILVVLAVFSAVIGIAAMRNLRHGYIGLAIFAAIGIAAALTRPNATLWDVLPTLIGALVAAYALRLLVRAAGGQARRGVSPPVAARAATPRPPRRRVPPAPPDFTVPADPALADPALAGPPDPDAAADGRRPRGSRPGPAPARLPGPQRPALGRTAAGPVAARPPQLPDRRRGGGRRGRRRPPGRADPLGALQRVHRPGGHPVPEGRAAGAAAAGWRESRHQGPQPVRHPELRRSTGWTPR